MIHACIRSCFGSCCSRHLLVLQVLLGVLLEQLVLQDQLDQLVLLVLLELQEQQVRPDLVGVLDLQGQPAQEE